MVTMIYSENMKENMSTISHSLPIHSWNVDDQPRNKLLNKGCSALSDSELLSLLINTGHKNKSALEIAQEILRSAQNNLNELGKLSIADLQKISGVGESKATIIVAAIELGRRRQNCGGLSRETLRSSNDVAQFLITSLKDYKHEVFGVLFLNRANRIKNFEIISQGGITGTVCDPRIILKKALDCEATSIILTHNHPSGNLKPSRADEEITQKIKHAASFLDVRVLDHMIVGDDGYYSFADAGLM